MKIKSTVLLSALLISSVTISAQKNVLRFNEDGKFKIVQFTDTHLGTGEGASEYRCLQADKTLARISRVVNLEKPDFIVLTGDVVTGGDASETWSRLLDSLASFKTPFCIVYGNHDPERKLTRQEMSRPIAAAPYSLNRLNKAKELADMEIEVLSSKSDRPALLLYCMDSRDYSTIETVRGYGWFTTDQIEWLRNSCMARTEANGGISVPSLAFFHICLQEYAQAWNNPKNSRKGKRAEDECPGALNTGMFAAMVESGSVMGTFVGHDHDNDYVVAEKGIALGYGRFSGDDSTYNNLRPGARIIVVEEGQRCFESWILEDDGRIAHRMKFSNGKIE